jgi:xanthine/uracil permease
MKRYNIYKEPKVQENGISSGMSLAAMVGIILNLALPENLKSKKSNQ